MRHEDGVTPNSEHGTFSRIGEMGLNLSPIGEPHPTGINDVVFAKIHDDIMVRCGAEEERIGARASVKRVIAGIAADEIIPRAAIDHVIASIADKEVIAGIAVHNVIVDAAIDGVGP
jgi:hypothetical protein